MPFVRLVASMDDVDMFYTIYDSFNMFFTNGHYATDKCLFSTADYIELIMDNEKLFNGLFEIKAYTLKLGENERRKLEKNSITYYTVNPILNNCLRYALQHLLKYKKQAIEILKFGIKHNARIAEEHNLADCYVCNELGGIRDLRDNDSYGYYEFAIVTNEENVQDKEIKDLIERLPKFNDYGGWRK